jgi:hypothetical protein
VQRFAQKEPDLGTQLLIERREVSALKRVKRGAWEHLGWEKRMIVPRGSDRQPMAAMGLCRRTSGVRAGSFEIVDEESVKLEEASVTPVDSGNRKVVEMCMLACAAVLCCALIGVQRVRGPGVARSRGGAVMYLSNQDAAVLMASVIRFEVCRPKGPECVGVQWSASERENSLRTT